MSAAYRIAEALKAWPGFRQPLSTFNHEAMASEIVRHLWQHGHIICEFNSIHVWRDLRPKNYPDYEAICEWNERLNPDSRGGERAVSQERIRGWAPGNYSIFCCICGKETPDCDKRATQCRPCAEAIRDGAPTTETTAERAAREL